MSCDYYIQHNIVINYYSINKIIEEHRINMMKEYRYVGFISDENKEGDHRNVKQNIINNRS
jgi:hypothetical protein